MTLLMQDFCFVNISFTCFFGTYCAKVFGKFNAFHKCCEKVCITWLINIMKLPWLKFQQWQQRNYVG